MDEMNEWIDVFCGKQGRDSDKLLASPVPFSAMCCIVKLGGKKKKSKKN